jgi:hypothetical protein
MSEKALKAAFLVAPLVIALSGCPSASLSGGSPDISITASSGILTAGAAGTWVLDAGYVARKTIDVVTFKVTNSGSADFAATGSASFTNNDFALGISGTFTAPAGGSNSFTGSFTPTDVLGNQETGTLILNPTNGSPITIQLKGTSGPPSFMSVIDTVGLPITDAPGTVTQQGPNTFQINNGTLNTITLTGNPLIGISNAAEFTLGTSPSTTIGGDGGSTTFGINDLNGNGATTTVTITGQESVSGTFFFTFALDDQSQTF